MKISGIVEQKDLVLLNVTSKIDQLGLAEAILEKFAKEHINIEYITEAGGKDKGCIVFSFCVTHEFVGKSERILLQLLEKKIIETMNISENISFIGIYGPHFREKPMVAFKLCRAFSDAGVNIIGISTSISTVACIIDQTNFKTAKNAILKEFELAWS